MLGAELKLASRASTSRSLRERRENYAREVLFLVLD